MFRPDLDLGVAFGLPMRTGVNAPALTVAPGPTGDAQLACLPHPAVLFEGVVLRTIVIGRRTASLLYGAGDILPMGVAENAPFEVVYRTLRRTHMVPLDQRTLSSAGAVPALAMEIASAIERHSALLTLQSVIVQFPTIEERLEVLLPELASRWGAVTADGVVLPAFLSQTVLAALIGVRRPSLTTALAALTNPRLLRRLPDRRWLLTAAFAGVSA